MVDAGTKIATINPNSATNGGTAPLPVLDAGRYDPNQKKDPIPVRDAAERADQKNVGWVEPVWLADV